VDHSTSETTEHRTRWTVEETEFLRSQWDGTYATAAVIAECLGRTEVAVRQRWYETSWGTATRPVTAKPAPGTPSLHRQPDGHRRSTTTSRPAGPVCTTCWLELPAGGGGCQDCD
jgi:hypothetical protein